MFIRRENFKQYIKFYPTISFLIATNFILFLLTQIPIIGNEIYYGGMNVNYYVSNGQLWRIVTSIFLHGGFMHVFFNMFSLFLFGPEMEKIAGKARFITIYLLSGIFGNVATYFIKELNYATLGASGAIFGIFGAFLALVYYTRRTMPQLKQVILPIVVISLIMTFLQPNVNVTGHLGGLATGFILGLVYFSPKNIIRWRIK